MSIRTISVFLQQLQQIKGSPYLSQDEQGLHYTVMISCDFLGALQTINSRLEREVYIYLKNAVIIASEKTTLYRMPSHFSKCGNGKMTKVKSAASKKKKSYKWRKFWKFTPNNQQRETREDLASWVTVVNPNPQIEVVLTRLRIEHTRLTHLWLTERGDSPLCEGCQELLTVATQWKCGSSSQTKDWWTCLAHILWKSTRGRLLCRQSH